MTSCAMLYCEPNPMPKGRTMIVDEVDVPDEGVPVPLDDTIREAAARAIDPVAWKTYVPDIVKSSADRLIADAAVSRKEQARRKADTALAALTPLIEAALIERLAERVEGQRNQPDWVFSEREKVWVSAPGHFHGAMSGWYAEPGDYANPIETWLDAQPEAGDDDASQDR